MRCIGIIGAMEEEVALLKEKMEIEVVVKKASMEFYQGHLNGREVVVVRSGIGSVHRGQFEAAKSQGFSPVQTMTLIILPQAMRIILPPLAVQAANLADMQRVGAVVCASTELPLAESSDR